MYVCMCNQTRRAHQVKKNIKNGFIKLSAQTKWMGLIHLPKKAIGASQIMMNKSAAIQLNNSNLKYP